MHQLEVISTNYSRSPMFHAHGLTFFSELIVNAWNFLPDVVYFSSLSRFKRSIHKVDLSRFLGGTENGGLEKSGLENVGPNRRGGKDRTGKHGTKFPGVEKAGLENAGTSCAWVAKCNIINVCGHVRVNVTAGRGDPRTLQEATQSGN